MQSRPKRESFGAVTVERLAFYATMAPSNRLQNDMNDAFPPATALAASDGHVIRSDGFPAGVTKIGTNLRRREFNPRKSI